MSFTLRKAHAIVLAGMFCSSWGCSDDPPPDPEEAAGASSTGRASAAPVTCFEDSLCHEVRAEPGGAVDCPEVADMDEDAFSPWCEAQPLADSYTREGNTCCLEVRVCYCPPNTTE